MNKDSRLLRLGILGCGPIAQIAHFDAARKARNVELTAICDLADDLRDRMATLHQPRLIYRDFEEMLANPEIEAVLIGVADQFHVPLATKAVGAGKHVLVEKPLGVSVEECEELRSMVQSRPGFQPDQKLPSSKEERGKAVPVDEQFGGAGKMPALRSLVFQIGNNRRFDPGIAFARKFIQEEIGDLLSFKAWYWDSVYRYTMTDNLQPLVQQSAHARRPKGNPKADKPRYFLLTHASHLVDTARFLGGEITAVRARRLERFGALCWYVDVEFIHGALGHLDLTIPVRGDFEEGFQIQGEHGNVQGQVFLPWFHKASLVEAFSGRDRQYRRPMGEDAYSYKLQLESFADCILCGTPQQGANIDDGVAAMRALVAIARSVESGEWMRLADVTGGV
ncbi:MAG: Gfo/Idh/MocA family oxidoreductase [Verrucomicrobia bacterium]|nr:Gfo/Idh/MocA family oxidoreductase [Verrucomicrobiota bacterium]